MPEHPVIHVFQELANLVEAKAHDYADDGNVFSNFEGAARLTGLTPAQVFHVMLGIKMERIRQLMSGKNPKFESIEDSLMDLANYAALWIAWERQFDTVPLEQAPSFQVLTTTAEDAILRYLPED